MSYTGVNITGVNSPAVGDSGTTFSTTFDTAAQKLDEHDHSSGKGVRITASAIEDDAITAAKLSTDIAGNGLAGGGGTAFSVNVDGTGLEISSDQIRVKDDGVTIAKMATQDTSGTVGNAAVSSAITAFESGITRTSYSGTEDASVSITTSGGPVLLYLQNTTLSSTGEISCGATLTYKFERNSTVVSEHRIDTSACTWLFAPQMLRAIDLSVVGSAGTHTYKLFVKVGGSTFTTASGSNCKIYAVEL